MTDKILPEHYRSRSRDRSDQRRPTFQVLNAVQQPKTHSHGKRDNILSHFLAADQLAHHPHSHPGEEHNRDHSVYRENRDQNRDSIQSNYSADDNDNETHYPPSKVIGVHTVGKESCASVVSSYRGPACNFTAFFHQSNSNGSNGPNARHRTQSMSPGEVKSSSGRHRSKNQQDVNVVEEPSDLMVWNATKKTSRSNITLSDSEYRNLNALDKIKGSHKKREKPRSSSVPVHNTNQYNNNVNTSENPGLEDRDSMVFEQEGLDRISERIDECVPSMSPIEVSPSISIASTSYSMQISLVAQQLEEIQQAQNEVLKHLGEEITKVTGENERLRQEVDHVRDQNEGLLKVVHDTTDELERMKQIFRIRGMPHQQQQPQQEFIQHNPIESPQPLQQQQQQQHHRSSKQQHSPGERRDRESINSNSSNKSHSSKKSARGEVDPVMMPQVAVESPYLKQSDGLSTKPPKAKKERKSRPSDDELATLDDQEVAGMVDDPTDDNVSHRSNESQQKSSKRRSRENGHRHHSQSPRESRHENNNSGSETHRRSRSRSKEGHRGSSGGRGEKMRSSHCGDEHVDKKRHLNKQVYQDDCNDSIEMRQSEGGCLRVFTCCWSSPTIRSRTDDYSVDDIVLREYRE